MFKKPAQNKPAQTQYLLIQAKRPKLNLQRQDSILLLNDPATREVLIQHFTQTASLENFQFYESVTKLNTQLIQISIEYQKDIEELQKDKETQKQFQEIYAGFIDEAAKQPINISSEHKALLRTERDNKQFRMATFLNVLEPILTDITNAIPLDIQAQHQTPSFSELAPSNINRSVTSDPTITSIINNIDNSLTNVSTHNNAKPKSKIFICCPAPNQNQDEKELYLKLDNLKNSLKPFNRKLNTDEQRHVIQLIQNAIASIIEVNEKRGSEIVALLKLEDSVQQLTNDLAPSQDESDASQSIAARKKSPAA